MNNDFAQSTDAQVWAEAFMEFSQGGDIDKELMTAWFANTIMRGYDSAIEKVGGRLYMVEVIHTPKDSANKHYIIAPNVNSASNFVASFDEVESVQAVTPLAKRVWVTT